jgi:hypothetical protein
VINYYDNYSEIFLLDFSFTILHKHNVILVRKKSYRLLYEDTVQ